MVVALCAACEPSVADDAGVDEPLALEAALQSRGDQVRLLLGDAPMACETADAGLDTLDACRTVSLEIFMPQEKLAVGPVFFTDDMRVHIAAAGGHRDDSSCFRTTMTRGLDQKLVITELTEESVSLRLAGFALDLDSDGTFDALLDAEYSGPRCTLDEPPIELPAGGFVVLPGDPPRLIGSSAGATCDDPDQYTGACDTWRADVTVDAALLTPGTGGDTLDLPGWVESTLTGFTLDACGGGLAIENLPVEIEETTDTELRFSVKSLDVGTSIPIAGHYVARICR